MKVQLTLCKLGYGGTKTEMERLLKDATAISGVEYDISSLSDVYEAIHVIQGELGITGTTAKEASETISGSLAAAKSAWSNLVTGVADDNANFDELISNFVESASTAAENILPRIGTALQGIGQLVEGLAPVIAEAVPVLIETVLPTLLQSAVSLVTAIGGALLENLPMLIDCGLQFILALAQSLIDNLPTLIPAVVNIILTIVEKLTEPDTLLQLSGAAMDLIIALAEGLINALPQLISKAPVIVGNYAMAIIRNAPKLLSAAGQLIGTIVRGIGAGIGKLIAKGREIIGAVKGGVMQKINEAKTWGKDLISNFIGGITAKWQALKDKVSSVAQTVKDFLGFSEPKEGPLSNFHTYAPDMMELFAKGIRDNTHLITDQIGKSFDFGADISNVSAVPAVSGGGAENITINVYPSKGMDEKELARHVAVELQRGYRRKAASIA